MTKNPTCLLSTLPTGTHIDCTMANSTFPLTMNTPQPLVMNKVLYTYIHIYVFFAYLFTYMCIYIYMHVKALLYGMSIIRGLLGAHF